jgi:hypothetical protein
MTMKVPKARQLRNLIQGFGVDCEDFEALRRVTAAERCARRQRAAEDALYRWAVEVQCLEDPEASVAVAFAAALQQNGVGGHGGFGRATGDAQCRSVPPLEEAGVVITPADAEAVRLRAVRYALGRDDAAYCGDVTVGVETVRASLSDGQLEVVATVDGESARGRALVVLDVPTPSWHVWGWPAFLRAYLRAQLLRGLSLGEGAQYHLNPEGEAAARALRQLVEAVRALESRRAEAGASTEEVAS